MLDSYTPNTSFFFSLFNIQTHTISLRLTIRIFVSYFFVLLFAYIDVYIVYNIRNIIREANILF